MLVTIIQPAPEKAFALDAISVHLYSKGNVMGIEQYIRLYIRLLALFGLILLLPGTISSQEDYVEVEQGDASEPDYEYRGKFADFSYLASFPVQTFAEKVDRDLHGFALTYLVERSKTDYNFWGFSLSYNHVGSDSNSFLIGGPGGAFDADERTATNLWSVHFLYRIYPDFYFWRIEPFFEAALGTNMFFTTTNTTYYDENSTTQFDFNQFNAGLSFGINLGFTLQIVDQYFFHTKFGYYSGTATTYLVKADNGSDIPLLNFNEETTQINHLQLKLGLTYAF